LSVIGLLCACTRFFKLGRCQTNVLQMYIQLTENFHPFWDLFFCILVAGIYVTKVMTKCLQFVYIFADLLFEKCLTKFPILSVKCLTNYLQTIWLHIACCMEKYSFLLNNCLIIHRIFEAYCLYREIRLFHRKI
jgi:hypothetical protein